jgi:hypothetical protein
MEEYNEQASKKQEELLLRHHAMLERLLEVSEPNTIIALTRNNIS